MIIKNIQKKILGDPPMPWPVDQHMINMIVDAHDAIVYAAISLNNTLPECEEISLLMIKLGECAQLARQAILRTHDRNQDTTGTTQSDDT